MNYQRRRFLKTGAAITGAGIAGINLLAIPPRLSASTIEHSVTPETYAVIPVVGDGKWIWTEPPKDQTGYLEPRDFNVEVTIAFIGTGFGRELQASTVFPIECSEQRLFEDNKGISGLKTNGCSAQVNQIGEASRQMLLYAPTIAAGQTVSATLRMQARLFKAYMGHKKEDFPADQPLAEKLFDKQYFRNSPGIKANTSLVKELAGKIAPSSLHPWDQAKLIHEWVWENIEGIPGKYTSVEAAIKNKRGDCEERATVFIALCRACGIPARQVWVPSHAWAEIGLHDGDNRPHWIPVHTAAYSWFGWTGAHELVLQKGDHIHLKHRKRTVRLIDDWYRLKGPRPEMQYTMSVIPYARENADPGPGGRAKMPDGRWQLVGDHPAKKFMRDK